MDLLKLISPDGDEVLVTESGVAALKDKGYKDAPKSKKQPAKKDEAADEATE